MLKADAFVPAKRPVEGTGSLDAIHALVTTASLGAWGRVRIGPLLWGLVLGRKQCCNTDISRAFFELNDAGPLLRSRCQNASFGEDTAGKRVCL